MGFIQPKRIQVKLLKPDLALALTWWSVSFPSSKPPSSWRLPQKRLPAIEIVGFDQLLDFGSSGWKIGLWLDRWQNQRLSC
jgi:hypothetical protein